MIKRFILSALQINQLCLLKELRNLFKKLNLMPFWFRLTSNGGIPLRCSSMLIHRESLLITTSILINILKCNPLTCGIQIELPSSGSDSTLTQLCLSTTLRSHQALLSWSLVLKSNLLVKKLRSKEPNFNSLDQNLIKKLGLDFIMKLEWISQVTSGLECKCKDKLSGKTKELRRSIDFTILSHINSLKSVLIQTWSTGTFNQWMFSSQSSKKSLLKKEMMIFLSKLISLHIRKLSLLSINGIWKVSSTNGLLDMDKFQEVFHSQMVSTQSEIWTWRTVFSKDFTTPSTEKLLQQTLKEPQLPTPTGLLVITEKPTGNTNIEICEQLL